MNLVKKSGVVRTLLALALFSVFSGYANRSNCARRAVCIACQGAQTIGSAILLAGGFVALRAKPAPTEVAPAVVTGTSIMLVGLGLSGIYNGARGVLAEIGECANDEQAQDHEQKED